MDTRILIALVVVGFAGCTSAAKKDASESPLPAIAPLTSRAHDYARELVEMIHTPADSAQLTSAASLFSALNGRAPLSPAELREKIAQVYLQRFAEDQLRDIVAFLKTPAGQLFWRTQPEIFALQVGIPFQQGTRK
jgi:hypothetical protein